MSISRYDNFEVQQGINDTFLWRIGSRAFYSQHVVTLTPGSYNAIALAEHITERLNASTLLGAYKGDGSVGTPGWVCNYLPAGGVPTRDNAGFDITYNQTLVLEDDINANLLKWTPRYNRRGLQAVFQVVPPVGGGVNSGEQLLTMGATPPLGDPAVLFEAPSLNTSACFTGDRSIFSNGGRIYVDVAPIAVISGANFEASPVLITRDGEDTVVSTWTPDPNRPNGWQYSVAVPSGGIGTLTVGTSAGTNYQQGEGCLLFAETGAGGGALAVATVTAGGAISALAIIPGEEGQGCDAGDIVRVIGENSGSDDAMFVVATETSATSFAAILPEGILATASTTDEPVGNLGLWTGVFVVASRGATAFLDEIDLGEYRDNGALYVLNDGMRLSHEVQNALAPFNMAFATAYPPCRLGFARNKLVTAFQSTPLNPNAAVTDDGDDGMDTMITLRNNPGLDGVFFDLAQMTTSGRRYPQPGWRVRNPLVKDLDPIAMPPLPSGAASWTTFQYGVSSIRMNIEVQGNGTKTGGVNIEILHNAAGGATAFTENQTLCSTGQTASPQNDLLGNFVQNIKEQHYPLRPVIFATPGYGFDSIPAVYTLGGVVDPILTTQSMELIGVAPDAIDEALQAQANPLVLSSLFKFGPAAGASQDPIHALNPQDAEPRLANAAELLGMEPIWTFPQGSATRTVASDAEKALVRNSVQPTIHVELTDFNIESWSGESSDCGRAVAIVPSEQWGVDRDTGVLHYSAPYPIPIDLNVNTTQPFYSLQCRLRNPDGTLVSTLANPTCVTLRVGETEESRQQRVMTRAMKELASAVAERQDSLISTMNSTLPRL
jgi:hypothetical protein